MCRLVSFQSDYSRVVIPSFMSPAVSWEADTCLGRVWEFWKVILHGEVGLGMHSRLREAGFTQMWWIQGAISATLTAVEVDKITTTTKKASAMRF
jgi:hypothetical protein